jgi:hypothetical protein
MATTV